MQAFTKEEVDAFVAEWTAALRSGKYTQTQKQLFDGKGYCCLGVACDILQQKVGGAWSGNSFWTEEDSSTEVLPVSISEALGMSTKGAFFTGRVDDSYSLTELNDAGYSFAKIADVIEQQKNRLFYVYRSA